MNGTRYIGDASAQPSYISENRFNQNNNVGNSSIPQQKTFEDFAPHQYILNFPCWKLKEDGKCKEDCEPCKQNREEFEKWALFIRKYGERCKMLKTTYTVLCVDDKQYWTMGDPMNTTWVLNRSLIDEPRVPQLEWLDRIKKC